MSENVWNNGLSPRRISCGTSGIDPAISDISIWGTARIFRIISSLSSFCVSLSSSITLSIYTQFRNNPKKKKDQYETHNGITLLSIMCQPSQYVIMLRTFMSRCRTGRIYSQTAAERLKKKKKKKLKKKKPTWRICTLPIDCIKESGMTYQDWNRNQRSVEQALQLVRRDSHGREQGTPFHLCQRPS